jgi:hypothetical protein
MAMEFSGVDTTLYDVVPLYCKSYIYVITFRGVTYYEIIVNILYNT